MSHSFGGCKSKINVSPAGLVPYEGHEGKICSKPFSLPCRWLSSLCVSSHCLFSVYAYVQFPLFIKHQSFWIRNHPCDLLLTWLFPQIGSLSLGFCRRDTIHPIIVTNFWFLQTNIRWVRFFVFCLPIIRIMSSLLKKLLTVFTLWAWERGALNFLPSSGKSRIHLLAFTSCLSLNSLSLSTVTH